jgi:hypothetical protein
MFDGYIKWRVANSTLPNWHDYLDRETFSYMTVGYKPVGKKPADPP